MIIDAHTHIFPPEVAENRERFLDGEPAFAAIYQNPDAPMVTASGLVAAMDQTGVDVSWALGFPWVREENARLHNDYLAASQKRFPARLRCLAGVHPPLSWAGREAKRALGLGLCGLGELAFYDCDLDPASLAPLCALAAEAGLPLLLHTNEPVGHRYPGKAPMTLAALYKVVKDNQATKLVLAHMGAGLFYYSTLKKEVTQALANVWIDTAASPFLYHPRAYGLAVSLLGREKVLFGTDYPLLGLARYVKEFSHPESGLTDQDREWIMGRSAARLLP